jgi:hypothetical protein
MKRSNQILEAILTLHQATEAGFVRVEARVNRFEARLYGLETWATRFDPRVMQRFEGIEERFNTVGRRFDKVDRHLDDIDRRLAWLEHA